MHTNTDPTSTTTPCPLPLTQKRPSTLLSPQPKTVVGFAGCEFACACAGHRFFRHHKQTERILAQQTSWPPNDTPVMREHPGRIFSITCWFMFSVYTWMTRSFHFHLQLRIPCPFCQQDSKALLVRVYFVVPAGVHCLRAYVRCAHGCLRLCRLCFHPTFACMCRPKINNIPTTKITLSYSLSLCYVCCSRPRVCLSIGTDEVTQVVHCRDPLGSGLYCLKLPFVYGHFTEPAPGHAPKPPRIITPVI